MTRRVLSGEFIITNRYLQADLKSRGLWTKSIISKIKEHRGSIQAITEIPDDLRMIYKTSFEISQKTMINLSADRGAFIDQSQSFNINVKTPTVNLLTSIQIHAWKKGLKTGVYYVRREQVRNAIAYTTENKVIAPKPVLIEDEVCESCSG